MAEKRGFGLYIHWPYCTRICPYCDFNIYKNKPDSEQALVAAILTDMEYWRAQSGPQALSSIHFGGGTPSLISAGNLETIITRAINLWGAASSLEVGLEANPNDITLTALESWRGAGIERLSIGIQSFDDKALRFLGRDHDGAQANKALAQAVKIMPRVSADLIYGWAGQGIDAWDAELSTALASGPAHISAYQLTIEARTAFAKAQTRGEPRAVDDDTSADLYEHGLGVLKTHGFTQYEVSNFAKTKDAYSRHNLLYWQGGDYVGVGPGAHGRITIKGKRQASICALRPKDYTQHVHKQGHGSVDICPLSPRAHAQEYVLMGLRITGGISLARYKEISGKNLSKDTIAFYEDTGLLRLKNGHLSATHAGRLVLDRLSHELLIES